MTWVRPEGATLLLARKWSELIRDGRWSRGELLPSARVLAEEHGVSRQTVRLALAHLASRGLVTIHPGIGARVEAPRTEETVSFEEILRRVGGEQNLEPVAQELREIRRFFWEKSIAVAARVRSLDEIPALKESAGNLFLAAYTRPDRDHAAEMEAEVSETLARVSKLAVLPALMRTVSRLLILISPFCEPADWKGRAEVFESIVEALEAGDEETVLELLKRL